MLTGIIVLEGPDGIGKTRLGKFLAQQHAGVYMHQTYRFKERMFTYHLAVIHKAIKLSKDRLVVLDRWWPSEVAYANAYRNGTKWPLAYRMLDQLLLKHCGVYLFLLPEDDCYFDYLKVFNDNVNSGRAEMFKDPMPAAIQYEILYNKIRHWPHVLCHRGIDPRGNDRIYSELETQLTGMLDNLQHTQYKRLLNPRLYSMTGHAWYATTMIVGDRTNPKKRHGNWYPFCDYQASSLHLAKALEYCGIMPHEYMLCNYSNDPKLLHDFLSEYEISVVVLGDIYNDILKNAGSNLAGYKALNCPRQMTHPAYDLRFKKGHHFKYELMKIINSFRHEHTINLSGR